MQKINGVADTLSALRGQGSPAELRHMVALLQAELGHGHGARDLPAQPHRVEGLAQLLHLREDGGVRGMIPILIHDYLNGQKIDPHIYLQTYTHARQCVCM